MIARLRNEVSGGLSDALVGKIAVRILADVVHIVAQKVESAIVGRLRWSIRIPRPRRALGKVPLPRPGGLVPVTPEKLAQRRDLLIRLLQQVINSGCMRQA